jgi:hypothetical protein
MKNQPWPFWMPLPGDLLVTGFPRRSNGSANGAYAIRGEAWRWRNSHIWGE